MSDSQAARVAISASFTAEPVELSVASWCRALEIETEIRFAPYNQLFPQLLDPQSEFGRNEGGLNVALLRIEDLGAPSELGELVTEFIAAADAAAERCASPFLIIACPPSTPSAQPDAEDAAMRRLADHWGGDRNIHFIRGDEIVRRYAVAAPLAEGQVDETHIPYSDEFFAALGSTIARELRLLFTAPTKVIVLDCDNTLWSGACAELGPDGVGIEAGHRTLHEALLSQQRSGVLLCLCSKNSAQDVHATFDLREGIAIDRNEHLVAERINWEPKSENIASLAEELNLGLDSFLFLDDNPVECAEVRSALPEVLTVEVPRHPASYPHFCEHLWPFDQRAASGEDGERTRLYQREAQRLQARREAPDFGAFLDGLELEIDLAPACSGDLDRLAQLTRRTNQFNASPSPASESDLRARIDGGDSIYAVRVGDRFGDYGLAGAVFGRPNLGGEFEIDGLFLSCRVLGRGVEHEIINRLASERDLRIAHRPTERNEPVRQFLESVPVVAVEPQSGGAIYHVPAGVSLRATQSASASSVEAPRNREQKLAANRLHTLARTPAELDTGAAVLAWMKRARRRRPELDTTFSLPRPGLERDLAAIWEEILGIEAIGALDPFSDLGGRSLELAQLQAKLAADCGLDIPLEELFDRPTVRALAEFIEHGDRAPQDTRDLRGALTQRPEIAVVGIALRVPGASTPDEFWRNLRDGVESISELGDEQLAAAGVDLEQIRADPHYVRAKGLIPGIDKFDASFFGILPKDAEIMDPQQRLFLELAHEAIESAGYDPGRYPDKVGVYAGAYLDTYLIANICRDGDYLDKWVPNIQVGALGTELGNDKDYLATRVAFKLNLRGPSMTLQTACSTSLVAIAQACQALATGQTDMAVAGGVTITVPQEKGYSYQEGGILSPDGHCHAFDHRAAGTVFSNGGGAVLLKRLDEAVADGDHIYSVIKGFALNNDGGEKHSYTAPSVDGQADVIAMAQRMADVDPATITCVEAHGTGTSLGDPIEVAGLTRAFRLGTDKRGFCALGSLKPNLGHLDVASGVAAVSKISLALTHGQIPPLINFERANPKIDFERSPFYPATSLQEWQPADGAPRRAGVSSFGVGGTNAHLVMEEAPPRRLAPSTRDQFLLPVSAKTAGALDAACGRLADWLRKPHDADLADIAYTLQVGRQQHGHRRFVVAGSPEEAAVRLAKASGKSRATRAADPPVAFLFPGQGAQKINMARELYDSEPFFREQINNCAELLKPEIACDLRDVIFPPADTDPAAAADALKQTVVAQPSIFVIEVALARLWMHWGVRPAEMVGHSVGEFAAACIAGVFSLEDGLKILAARGRLMGELPGGGMLSVRASEEVLERYLDERVELAAVNAAQLCVAAGPDEALGELARRLEADGLAAKPLHTSHAFHSWMMDPVIGPFTAVLESIALKAPEIPIFSTVTNAPLGESEATDPTYWARHLRNPVRFFDALTHLWSQPAQVLLEVGPGNTLATLARQNRDRAGGSAVFASSAHAASAEGDAAAVFKALGGLWSSGVSIDWDAFYAYEKRGRVPLPTYPFERKRFWKELPSAAAPSRGAGTPPPAFGSTAAEEQAATPFSQQAAATPPMETTSATHSEQLEACIKEELAELSGIDPDDLDRDASFLELGFDSLLLTQVSTSFESAFGVKVTLRDLLDEHPSIAAMTAHLAPLIDTATFAPAPTIPPTPATAPPSQVPAAATAAPIPALQGPMPVQAPGYPVAPSPGMPMFPDPSAQFAALAQQVQYLSQQVAAMAGANPGAPPLAAPVATPPPATPSAEVAAAPHRPASGEPESETKRGAGGPGLKIDRSLDTTLSERQQKHIEDLVERYTRKTARSKELTQRYRHCYADPRTASGFNRLWKEMCYQIVVEHSKGSRLLDRDGNEYIDLLNGFGPGFLGHSADFVVEALHAQIDKGFEVGPQSPVAGEVAELFCQLTGNERASFVNTGSEAVQAAMRLARTVTGRNKIALFAKDYHGNFDEVLARGVGSGDKARTLPSAPGIPRRAVEDILVLPYGTDAALETIRAHADQLAAVLVEPVQSRRPEFQPIDFCRELREITASSGSLLVFDEVITGFRTGPGGAQAWFGVEADLATYGKVVGGGLPIGVVAGKAEYMDTFDGGFWQYGDESFPEKPVTFFAGTFVRHPLAMAAAKATLQFLSAAEPELWSGLRAKADRLAGGVDAFFTEYEIPIRMPNFGSQMFVRVSEDEKYGNLLFYHLREKGVFLLESFPSYLTIAHSDADVDYAIAAFQESAAELQEAGFFAGSKPVKCSHSGRLTGPARKLAHEGGPDAPPPASPDKAGTASGRTTFPTTEAQKEILLASVTSPEASCAFNETAAIRFRGELQVAALEGALNALLARHDALRSRYPAGGEEFTIAPPEPLELDPDDLSDLDGEQRGRALDAAAEREASMTFDLEHGPLFRARLFKVADDEHLLLLTAHHIACDGWSFNILVDELGKLYSGSGSKLEEAPEFAEYALAKQRSSQSASRAEARGYWLGKYDGAIEESGIPTDRPRPRGASYAAAVETAHFEPELVAALRQVGAKHGATLYATVVAAFQSLLYRLSGDRSITVGIPAAGQAEDRWQALVGHCVDFLPLRTEIGEETTFAEQVATAKSDVIDAYEHREFAYGEIVRELAGSGRAPHVEFVLNLERMGEGAQFDGLEIEFREGARRFLNYSLFANLIESDSGLTVRWNYNSDLFDAATMRNWIEHFRVLLAAAAAEPARKVGDLPLLNPDAERILLQDWSGGGRGATPQQSIQSTFAGRVASAPDAVMLSADDGQMTYREASDLSDAVAARLLESEVAPGDRVAVFLERSPGLVLTLLGILKAGAAYVPIDPDYPAERIALMLRKAGARTLVTTSNLTGRLPELPAGTVRLVADAPEFFAKPALPLQAHEGCPEDLAYVIFTSGSTGEPKAVAIPHRGVVRLVRDTDYAELGADQVYLASAALSFDASTFEIWAPLLNGGRLVMLPAGTPTPSQIAQAIERHGVTTLWLTTGLFQLMVDEKLDALKGLHQLLTGGDVLSLAHVRKALPALGDCRLINAYGPTENTTFTTCHSISSADLELCAVPIGKPIAGTTVYILDGAMRPVPAGVEGDLYTGGAGLAIGYLDDAEKTAESFVEHPSLGRLYRTGDRARFRGDGSIDFLGRRDHQAKIRGFRVETGEIESALAALPGVARCAVVVRGQGAEAKTLAAYVVPSGEAADTADLIAELSQTLPAYLLPESVTKIDELPLNPSGKVDYSALPEPDSGSIEKPAYRPPADATEQRLQQMWQELLGKPHIGVEDDFFAVGGHSLLGLRLITRIEDEFDRRLPLGCLLESPTIRGLSRQLGEGADPLADGRAPQIFAIAKGNPEAAPLFAIHGGDGGALFYRHLGERIDPHATLYALESPLLRVAALDGIPGSIEEIAADYLQAIRPIAGHSLRLSGYSFGGVIAYEIACQLAAAGEEVDFLGLFDTCNPAVDPRPYNLAERISQNWKHKGGRVTGKLGALGNRFATGLVERRRRDGATAEARALLGQKVAAADEELRRVQLNEISTGLLEKYKPKPYPGRLTLFRAEVPDDKFEYTELLGWEGLAEGGIEVRDVPGGHLTMFEEDYADELADAVASALDEQPRVLEG